MYSIKHNILYFIVFAAVVEVQSLVELREETKDLAIAEAALRKTVNGIFSTLKLDHVKHKVRFGEFAAIHNFFVTITLQDDDNLTEIARLVKVDNIDNNTQRFIAQLNEVLNEDHKSYEAGEDEYVTAHIETFIRNLEYLKFKYGFDKNNAKLGINIQVLNHLKPDDTSQNNTKKALEVNEDGNLLNSNEFWTSGVSRRIFGGHRESIKTFPFMASVQFFKKFQCGGSIIKSDLVITSASCLQIAWNNRFFRDNPAFLSVQVGCNLYEGCDENIPVLEVYFHPQYNPENLNNNLAIMRTVRILKFGRKIKKFKKIDFDRDPRPLPTNTIAITIVGWGAKSASNIVSNIWHNRLSYAVLDYYPLTECQEVYSKGFVTEKNFCAGFVSKGGGACNRDAGGPGVAFGKLYGVVSFGAPNCGAPDAPTVFTKLGFYAEWIEGIIDMKVPTGLKITTKQTPQETWNVDSLVMTPKPGFKITPVIKGDAEARTPVPSENALTTLDENKLFKEFVRTMFGSEEAKEYLDQYDSDTDIGTQEKVTSKNIYTPFIDKPIAETTTEANIEEQSSGELEVPQDVHKGSVRMTTIIKNFEEPVVKSEEEEEDTTTRHDTSPMNLKMDLEELSEQNIAKLINDIDIQDLWESAKEKTIKAKKPKRMQEKTKRKEIKSNKDNIKPKEIKLITDKIKPIDVISSNDKIKPIERKRTADKIKPIDVISNIKKIQLEIKLTSDKMKPIDVITNIDKVKPKEMERNRDKIKPKETQHHKDKIKPKMQTSQKEEETEVTVETNDDYTEESDDDDYDIYHSDDPSQGRLDKNGRSFTFRQNSTDDISDIFSHKDLLKLLHEVVAEVVESATSKQYTNGTIARR